MSKAVLISIRPKWCEMIASGQKTIEVRKTRPNLEPPFKCYIYQTGEYIPAYILSPYAGHRKPGNVIGEFICDEIYKFSTRVYLGEEQTIHDNDIVKMSCVPRHELREYEGNATGIFGWHISDLVIYDKPKELSEFRSWNTGVVFKDGYPMPTHEIKRPPQSWCYVEELVER